MCEGECHSLGSLPDLAGTAVHEDARLHSDERREKAHDGVEKVGMARNGDEAHDSAGASVDKAGSACTASKIRQMKVIRPRIVSAPKMISPVGT